MTGTVVGVTADASVAFDATNPHVGMKDGVIHLSGPASQYRIPFSLQRSGDEKPTTEQIHAAVANALHAEGWSIQVKSVQYTQD